MQLEVIFEGEPVPPELESSVRWLAKRSAEIPFPVKTYKRRRHHFTFEWSEEGDVLLCTITHIKEN